MSEDDATTRRSAQYIAMPRFEAKTTIHDILDPMGYSVRGWGMGVKPKRGTPSKPPFKKKLEIFKSRATPIPTSGFVELLQKATSGLNPQINFAAEGGGGGMVLSTQICAG